jgi:hypothetical protein
MNVVMRYAPFADEPMADHDPVEIVEWFEAAVGKVAAQRKAQRQAQHD